MATTMHPSFVPSSSTPNPPTPPYPAFPRLQSGASTSSSPSITRNASTSSSCSTASTSSSLIAAPIRPPPIETRTAATSPIQLPSSAELHSPRAGKAGPSSNRGLLFNGPRSRSTVPFPPTAFGVGGRDTTPERSSTAPIPDANGSPTTPKAPRWVPPEEAMLVNGAGERTGPGQTGSAQRGPRVTVSMEPVEARAQSAGGNARGRDGKWSTPSSPVDRKSPRGKLRTLSVDGRGEETRERRTSQVSAASSSGQPKKLSLKDFVLGEELGRGSYSTVVQATSSFNSRSTSSPRLPKKYAIKIINQAHLLAEKKAKYAIVERDALIRLGPDRAPGQVSKGHRRGPSNSSSTGTPGPTAPRRRSNASINSVAAGKRDSSASVNPQDRLSVHIDTVSPIAPSPHSPVSKSTLAGRRPSRSAEPPEMVPERSEENVIDSPVEARWSRPPSPVKEENEATPLNPTQAKMEDSPVIKTAPPTPDLAEKRISRTRRESMAPSERSVTSAKSYAHPGVIKLYSTFNDAYSLYFVLDLAPNGELLGFIRKHGSFDLESARYYAAQLIDTIEYMHDREVIHRDLKPENILLDDDMRIKITDFGSAKILGTDKAPADESSKRSFVGSADFVSPEVLRNEPAVYASDVWAFGCILFQMVTGKPPFRAATDYLTFQKILKLSYELPDDIDPDAKSLIEGVLHRDPAQRLTPAEIKSHPFFAPIDFASLWSSPAPTISTGIAKPVQTLATAGHDAELWAVFDDEVSDGGFEFDEDDPAGPRSPLARDHSNEPRFDRYAAAEAVQFVDDPRPATGSTDSLEPPRPGFAEGQKKRRKWSAGSKSARTSSSSSNNRTALSGLLETMGLGSTPGTPPTTVSGGTPKGSVRTRTSRTSDRSDEQKAGGTDNDTRLSSLLLANEQIVMSTPISVRTSTSTASSLIPSFLLHATKRRHLILTDLPRLVEVKDDKEEADKGPRIKFEAVFTRPVSSGIDLTEPASAGRNVDGDTANSVVDVQGKGSKGFIVNTPGGSVLYTAESAEARDKWIAAIRRLS